MVGSIGAELLVHGAGASSFQETEEQGVSLGGGRHPDLFHNHWAKVAAVVVADDYQGNVVAIFVTDGSGLNIAGGEMAFDSLL